VTRSPWPAAACALALIALPALAQFPADPPKSFPRVVEYRCTDGEDITVTYFDKAPEFARITTKDGMWKASPVPGSSGTKFSDPGAKIEWLRKGTEGVLTNVETGQVIKTCKAFSAPGKQ
jgi:membrane-bound inhibitor of C-type lysozyme